MKKNGSRKSLGLQRGVTFIMGSWDPPGRESPRQIAVRGAGLSAAEVGELASLDRRPSDDLTQKEKGRLEALRVRRSAFGLANMTAALIEARAVVDYYRGFNLTDARCASNPMNYCNHYPTMQDPAYFAAVKTAATAMGKVIEQVFASRYPRQGRAAKLRGAIRAIALLAEPALARLKDSAARRNAERMKNYDRIRVQEWRRGAKYYRVVNQRDFALWVQFEEVGTRKRRWEFLPECGPRASYRPVKAEHSSAAA